MTYDTPYIEKSLTKNIDTTVSLYVLAVVIVEGIYNNYIKSNLGYTIAEELILSNNKTSAKIAVVHVVTFIDLHNLNIVVMFFYIDINL